MNMTENIHLRQTMQYADMKERCAKSSSGKCQSNFSDTDGMNDVIDFRHSAENGVQVIIIVFCVMVWKEIVQFDQLFDGSETLAVHTKIDFGSFIHFVPDVRNKIWAHMNQLFD